MGRDRGLARPEIAGTMKSTEAERGSTCQPQGWGDRNKGGTNVGSRLNNGASSPSAPGLLGDGASDRLSGPPFLRTNELTLGTHPGPGQDVLRDRPGGARCRLHWVQARAFPFNPCLLCVRTGGPRGFGHPIRSRKLWLEPLCQEHTPRSSSHPPLSHGEQLPLLAAPLKTVSPNFCKYFSRLFNGKKLKATENEHAHDLDRGGGAGTGGGGPRSPLP